MTSNNPGNAETITYFEKPGKQNTDVLLTLAKERAVKTKITHAIVPSSSGASALKAVDRFKDTGIKIVVVTLHFGFSNEGEDRFDPTNRKELEGAGTTMLTGAHVLSGLERSMSRKYGGVSRTEVISDSIKALLGHGMKVCLECTLMAADGGAIPVGPDIEVLAMGGRSAGLDTAVILRPSHVNNLFASEIREIIAMPRLKHRSY